MIVGRRRIASRFAFLYLLALIISSTSAFAASKWRAEPTPLQLTNGAPALMQVEAPVALQKLTGTWLGHTFEFSRFKRSKWFALFGVGLPTAPGAYTFHFSGVTKAGREITYDETLKVGREHYPNTVITVEKKFTEPNPTEVAEIQKAKATKQDVFSRTTDERLWEGDFRPPVDARISDIFGTTRTFNEKVQSTHEGLDFAVPTGTKVSAMNSGTVALAQFLYFEGNCVMIDHGQGLMTLYLHLSQLDVKEGDHVKKGQEIGLSGGTGRATGPHLHVAVRWQGTYLSPALLMKLKLP